MHKYCLIKYVFWPSEVSCDIQNTEFPLASAQKYDQKDNTIKAKHEK